jgi:D-alanine-D-alanine ligase
MRPTKVLVLYNEPVLSSDHPDAESEHEILSTVEAVSKALFQAGYEVSRLGVSYDPDLLVSRLRSQRPDVVFNLFEGTAQHGHSEAAMAALLEWLGIPFTGCPAQTLCVARHKPLTKYLLQGAGLPTPAFLVIEGLPVPPCPLEWPVIVKPATQDASVGLDQGSVVTDAQKLKERVQLLLERYGPPVMVEQFIRGRELTVGLIEAPELQVLPVSEILFTEKDPSFWPIVTYDAKWNPGSRDYEATPPRYPADVSARLAKRLGTLAQQAFRLLGCRDYARVDFRVRPTGKPYILEVNPNPDFSPIAGFAAGLKAAGLTHAQYTVELVRNALARAAKPGSPSGRKNVNPEARDAQAADRDAIRQVIESWSDLPDDEIAFAVQTLDSALEGGAAQAVVVEQEGQVLGYAGFGKAARTADAYDLHWMGVASDCQGQGLGWKLLQAVESHVLAAAGRVLVVEMSAQPAHSQARQFFLRQGFRLAGDLPDFFCEGEGRLTFAKYLSPAKPE